MCDLAVNLTGMVGEVVVGRNLTLPMQCECPIHEPLPRPDEGPMVIDGIRVVGGEHQLAVQTVYAMSTVHSLRIEPQILMTSAVRTTESAYAFTSPQLIKVRTLPVKVAFNPGDDGAFPGASPYICSPSGFGQRASCHPRYL